LITIGVPKVTTYPSHAPDAVETNAACVIVCGEPPVHVARFITPELVGEEPAVDAPKGEELLRKIAVLE
jgi:hypothetical protein